MSASIDENNTHNTSSMDCLLPDINGDSLVNILPSVSTIGEENSHPNPHVGMEFESPKDVEIYYKTFARQQGQHESKDGGNEEACINNKKRKRKCSTSRTGCKASLAIAKGKKRDKWIITAFENTHNHVMVSPRSVPLLRCHKKMSIAAKSLVEKFNEEGLPSGKVSAIFNGGDLSFSSRDCWNHLRNFRRRDLEVGDAQSVFNYCKQKQTENPNFFYAIQCDEEDRMVNFFWIDARSRLAYQNFGDVVTFDSTYKTNKYSMPFAPFTGLNHHCQSILFGCALLQDETEKSFIWLFKTWLEAMKGKTPVSIITDQDLAIGAAIAKVFPNTRHRLCLWHIRKKFPEKLSHIYHKNSTFKRELKRCIRDSSSIEQFEEHWERIMVNYDLKGNEWLQELFKIRQSWIPVYNRSIFFAGMNTTQRSESINSFFDSFVNSSTTLREFVVKYDKVVNSRYEKERIEDFESRHRSRILSIGSKIEEHAASIYTRVIFLKFQDELAQINKFMKDKVGKDGSQRTYKVFSCYASQDSFIDTMDFDSKDAKCSCQIFEFMGILCRHILVIFQAKNIVEIPRHYILYRWTKEANRGNGGNSFGESLDGQDHRNLAILRSRHVHHQASLLSDLAEKYEEIYNYIVSKLEETYMTATKMEAELLVGENVIIKDSNYQNITDGINNEVHESHIKDPHISHTKGRKKDSIREAETGRFKSGLEKSLNKSIVQRKSCQLCGELGHNRRSCKKIKDSECIGNSS